MTRHTRPLVATAGLMAVLSVAFGIGILADPRMIDGAPAWLKPAKFAVSTAIYSATLAWITRFLTTWPRLTRSAAWTTAVVFVIEVGLVAVQAARGTTSHFNTSTILDGVVFSIMGAAIVVQTVAALGVTVALWRQPFTDRALGWSLRLGMAIAIAGAATGGLMTKPTEAQLASAAATHTMPRAGAHTVGAEDGGPGLPGTGWSVEHGDLRVPHFIGLHAMQALPLFVLALGRRRSDRSRLRLTAGAAGLYANLFVLLLAQALAGQPLVAPAGPMLTALATWAVATLAFVAWLVGDGRRAPEGGEMWTAA